MKQDNIQPDLDFDLIDIHPFGPPHGPGVYAVVVSGNHKETNRHIFYIGSSSNIYERVMKSHHPYRRLYSQLTPDIAVFVVSIDTEDYIELEKVLIKKYQPILNTMHK
jgi:excinuclease UvrABC nuclease subunit